MNTIKQEVLEFKKKYVDVINEINISDINLSQYKLNMENINNYNGMANLLLELKKEKKSILIKEKLKLFLLEPYSLFSKFKKYIFDTLESNSEHMLLNIEGYEIKPFINNDYNIHYSCINDTVYNFLYDIIKKYYDSFNLYDINIVNYNITNDVNYGIFHKIFGHENIRNELVHSIANLLIDVTFDEKIEKYIFKLMYNGSLIEYNHMDLCNIINGIYNFVQDKYINLIYLINNFNYIIDIVKQYDNKDLFCFRFNSELNKMEKFYFHVTCTYIGEKDVHDCSNYNISIVKNICEIYNLPKLLYFIDPSYYTNKYDFIYYGISTAYSLSQISNLRELKTMLYNRASNNYCNKIQYQNNENLIDIDRNMLTIIKEIEQFDQIPTFISNDNFVKNMYSPQTILDYYMKTKNIKDIICIFNNYNNICNSIDPLLHIYVDSKDMQINNLIIKLIESGVINFYLDDFVLKSFCDVRCHVRLISNKCRSVFNNNDNNKFAHIKNNINNINNMDICQEVKSMFDFLY